MAIPIGYLLSRHKFFGRNLIDAILDIPIVLPPLVVGLSLFALGAPLTILLGMPLVAIASGSNQGLSTAIVGDLSAEGRRGRQLGWLFTTGDLASAVGPLLAYALIPGLGLNWVYLLAAGLFVTMLVIAWHWAVRLKHEPVAVS